MNRCLSALDDYLLVSNSDAHSPAKLGREANLFDTEPSYGSMIQAMKTQKGFSGTIEFYPEEGKYHLDGHRKCGIRLDPQETMNNHGICPSCGKPVTVGVLYRVMELSDREKPKLTKDFVSLIPLTEILSEILGVGPATKTVSRAYEGILSSLGPELTILMDSPIKEIEKAGGPLLSKAIERMRKDKVIRHGGFDGEFGVIRLFDESEKAELTGQKSLFQRTQKQKKKKEKSPIQKIKKARKVIKKTQKNPSLINPIFGNLNPSQKKAVVHEGGHLLIKAGPGTGKTMTITRRIAHIIKSCQAAPEQILALTFTNKAAKEMIDRIDLLLSKDIPGKVRVATFHGFCFDVLKKEGERLETIPSGFTLCAEQDASFLTRQVVIESEQSKRLGSMFLKQLPRLKIASVLDNEALINNDLFPLFKKYQQKLYELGMVDLDDLETETLRLFKKYPDVAIKYAERFPWIFVDEYQDTSPVQAAILKKIIQSGLTKICAIGDPDQAIYGFRGADLDNFYRFDQDFPNSKEIELVRNYRSTQVILNGASDLLEKDSSLKAVSKSGDLIRIASCRTYAEEAEMIVEHVEKLLGGTSHFSMDSGRVSSHEEGDNLGFGDLAVLFRLNAQGDTLEEAFLRAGIPFIRSGEKSLISQYPVNIIWRFIQAFLYPDNKFFQESYLELLGVNAGNGRTILKNFKPAIEIADLIDEIIKAHDFDLSLEPAARIIRRLKAIAEKFKGDIGSFSDQLSLDRGIDHSNLTGDRVSLMSLHSSKGLEWPVVFITGCEDMLLPCLLFKDKDVEEEKRLLYVGITRARQKLILSHTKHRKINNRMFDMKPSPFLGLIGEKLSGPLERGHWKQKAKAHKQLELF